MYQKHSNKHLFAPLINTYPNRYVLILCTLIFGISHISYAQQAEKPENEKKDATRSAKKAEVPDFFELSLKELMDLSFNVSVSEATDKEESILKTPAIVSRYSATDLTNMGLNSLKDFLSFVPGLIVDQGAFGNGQIMVRGISENFGQKVLFMLDDVPYSQPSHSALPLLGIPLLSINHIEVIRGPGLSQQGSGATAGVIKIVTKDYVEKNARVQVGSNKHANAGFYTHSEFSPNHAFTLSGEAQDEDGFLAYYENDRDNVSTTNQRSEDFTSLLAKYNWNGDEKALHVTAHTYTSTVQGVANPRRLHNTTLTYYGDLFAVSYEQKASDNMILSAYSDYNKHHLTFEFDDTPVEGSQRLFAFKDDGDNNYRWRSGTRFNWTINNTVNWVLGYEYEHRETGDYEIRDGNTNQLQSVSIPADQSYEQALYTQIDTTFDNWRILAGLRHIDNSTSGQESLPQLSVVYTLDAHQSLKALYSVGFNSPNFTQTDIHIPNFPIPTNGNPDLIAEKVASYDISYTYFKNGHQFVGNIYYLQAKDFIQRVRNDDTVTFQNSAKFDRWGYELDYQLSTERLRYFMSLAYQYQDAALINDDRPPNMDGNGPPNMDGNGPPNMNINGQAKLVPQFTSSFGAYYALSSKHHTGFSWRFIGKRYSDNMTPIASYNFVNVHYKYSPKNWELTLTLTNLLDDNISNPDIGSNTAQKITRSDGFGYLMGINRSF